MNRKKLVADRNNYASILTKLEGGKSQIKLCDMRQAIKLMVSLEAALILTGHRSALLMLRKEALEKVKAQKGKK